MPKDASNTADKQRMVLRIHEQTFSILFESMTATSVGGGHERKTRYLSLRVPPQPFKTSYLRGSSMRNFLLYPVFLTLLIFRSAEAQNPLGFEAMVRGLIDGSVDTISSAEVYRLVQNDSVILLDARSREEYEVSHLPGALWVGYPEIQNDVVRSLQPSSKIVVYCSVGKRSEEVGEMLLERGFELVSNHFGGIFDWTNRDLPVVDMKGNEVRKAHPYNGIWGIWITNYEKVDDAE